ncbi:MAG: CynX/NimT family MFS transporter [Lachnospiraceae bacterium]|uniref:MFS transporter n=1 Tax=Parablautia sp. Marseille-Q6255 TaxID=3039593 RepID=UPI0024BC9A14|nr:MFS transporter [Parablautia sp. Marseille-Q6255]
MNIKIRKSKATVGLAFIVLCFCYMIPNYAQYQVSPLGSRIVEEYGLQLSQLSLLFSAPMIPAIFLSLLSGLLLDRFGTKSVIGVGLTVTAIGCVIRAFSDSYMLLFVGTMLTGFSACFINAGSGKIVGNLYNHKEVPGKMGILMAASTAAMTIANFTSAYFSSLRNAFIASSIIAFIGLILWFLFQKDTKQENGTSKSSGIEIKDCLKITVKNVDVWLIAFALFFIMAANMIIGSFLPTALGTRSISITISGYIAACYTVGNFLGCLIAPICIAKLRSQKRVLLIFSVVAAIGVAFAWMIPQTVFLAAGMLLTGIFLGGLIPTLLALPVQIPEIGPVYAGTAGGMIGTIQLLGAVLMPSYILIPVSGKNFMVLFGLGGLCMVAAAVLCQCIRRID